jgi:hypothetical protein
MGLGWSTPKSKSKSWAFDNRHQWIDGKAMYVMFSCAKKKEENTCGFPSVFLAQCLEVSAHLRLIQFWEAGRFRGGTARV